MSDFYRKVIAKNSTLKGQIISAVKAKQQSCYDLEDGLSRTHQSVSGTITHLVREGLLEIAPVTTVNKFGNEVRVYRVPA